MQIVFTPLFCWKEIENLGDLSRLRLVLDYLPDELLMRTLESHRGKGRDEYQIRAVWNSILAGVIFQHNSVESLRRELKRNDRLRRRYRFLPILSALGAVVLVACLIALPAIGPKLSYDEIIPRVLITRANGEKVAEGAMPFG